MKSVVLSSCAALAVLFFSPGADALPIHHHLEVLRPSSVEPARTVQHVVRVDHVAPPYTPPAPAPVPTSYSGGSYSIPSYIVECESGGNYSAQNASGAYGAYQIMPATAAYYGCDLSTPAGQDQCAAEIYAAEGASPWECG